LLEQMRIPLVVRAPIVDERERPGEAADAYLKRIVAAKVAAAGEFQECATSAGLLCADTSVVVDQCILGKPASAEEGVAMLLRLVGRSHEVMTRYAIVRADDAGESAARTVTTRLHMRSATAEELRRYVASGEGSDKAGGYAVQGLGAFLVTHIDGSYANVVGLPIAEVVDDLLRLGLLSEFP
jgi:septum formation protein